MLPTNCARINALIVDEEAWTQRHLRLEMRGRGASADFLANFSIVLTCRYFTFALEENWIRSLDREDPLEKRMATLIFLAGEFLGQRSLAGYNPWNHKESDTTELLRPSLSKKLKLLGK
ncbi:unnamed protein product [Rangifer tarandus platyrhynchus]|uniref:Uncharacterized protein n=1 Tax=Rangifer tarandus platyrhynchus TaxID=3082113 RepID=A0AC59YQH3_RANTA